MTDVSLTNSSEGTTISATGSSEAIVNDAGAVSFSLFDDTGDSDELNISLAAIDGDDDGVAEGSVTFAVTADAIETVNITSTATIDIDDEETDNDEATEAGDYINQFMLTADVVKSVKVSGDSHVALIIANSAETLTSIDATSNTGGVSVILAHSGINLKVVLAMTRSSGRRRFGDQWW